MNVIPLKNAVNANKILYIPITEDHSLPFADVLTIFSTYMSLKQRPALTGINATVLHPDADSWHAKFSCNLSLIQLRSMVNVKKNRAHRLPCSVL